MRQRIVIAIALACRPDILICDEPTTALDVTIQAQIIDLLKSLQKEYNFTTIFITHDLGVVASIADKVAVMYAGEIVEFGKVEEIFYDPRHPYTWSLLSSLPQLSTSKGDLYSIPGTPPSLYSPVKGDAFALRSDYAMQIDFEEHPPVSMFQIHIGLKHGSYMKMHQKSINQKLLIIFMKRSVRKWDSLQSRTRRRK